MSCEFKLEHADDIRSAAWILQFILFCLQAGIVDIIICTHMWYIAMCTSSVTCMFSRTSRVQTRYLRKKTRLG